MKPQIIDKMLNFINIDENTKQTQWNTKLLKLTNCGSVSEEKLYQHLKGNVSVRIRSTRNRLECALWAQLTNIYKQKTVGFIFTLTTNKHKHKTLWSKCPYVGTHLKGEDRAQSNKSFISKKKKGLESQPLMSEPWHSVIKSDTDTDKYANTTLAM